MKNVKKTLYEILEVSPSAPLPEIRAAHKRLSLQLVSGQSGLSREDAEFNLKVIDVALQTLSIQSSRDAYDAQLAPLISSTAAVVPLKVNAVSLGANAATLKIADAIENSHRMVAAIKSGHLAPIKVVSTTISSSISALKKIIAIIGFVLALGTVIKLVSMNGQSSRSTSEVAKAEEKVLLQEYYQTHGVRPESKAEADLLEVEARRKENAQREAALEKRQQEERYSRFVEESRREGDRVSENLHRGEERARREEEQRKQRLEQEKRDKEEAEREADRIRIEKERRKLGLDTPDNSPEGQR